MDAVTTAAGSARPGGLARGDAGGHLPQGGELLGAQGLANDEIAKRLSADLDAVCADIEEIFVRLGLPDECEEDRRVAAVLSYLRETAMR